MKNYLNFELDIKDLEKELDELKDPYNKYWFIRGRNR